MCFQWAEEWQLCTGRCDYWHITQSRADRKDRVVLLQLLWLSWMEHFFCSGREFWQRTASKKCECSTEAVHIYFSSLPSSILWFSTGAKLFLKVYGSEFSEWTVDSIPLDLAWYLDFIRGGGLTKKILKIWGSETSSCILARCVWADRGMWLACVRGGCSCCTL